MTARIGIVTGIKLEENLLLKGFKQAEYSDLLTACACGTVDGARQAAQDLITRGATHLVSFGVCGGLSPYVKAGDLILADKVAMNSETLDVNSTWHAKTMQQFPEARAGLMLSVSAPITDVGIKHKAYEDTGAIAVDVESFAVAKAAQEASLPCLIIRAVLDGAVQSLPDAALGGVNDAGETQVWPVIKSLLKHPQDLPALLALARDSGKAQDALKVIVQQGAPAFWADGR